MFFAILLSTFINLNSMQNSFKNQEKNLDLENLINLALDINLKNSRGETFLILAVKNYFKDLVKLIIDKKADLDVKDNKENTALIYSAKLGYADITKMLIKAGANLNLQNKNGDTALIKAVLKKHKNVVSVLVDSGADLNIENNNNLTPLMICDINNGFEIYPILKFSRYYKNTVNFLLFLDYIASFFV